MVAIQYRFCIEVFDYCTFGRRNEGGFQNQAEYLSFTCGLNESSWPVMVPIDEHFGMNHCNHPMQPDLSERR